MIDRTDIRTAIEPYALDEEFECLVVGLIERVLEDSIEANEESTDVDVCEAALAALEDGAYLARLGVDDETLVDTAYYVVEDLKFACSPLDDDEE